MLRVTLRPGFLVDFQKKSFKTGTRPIIYGTSLHRTAHGGFELRTGTNSFMIPNSAFSHVDICEAQEFAASIEREAVV